MLFRSLNICNLGPFRGKHHIELTSKKNAPIILFGALNGSGKTTLFDSIQLALFGKYIRAAGKLSGSYDKYLRSLINRDCVEGDIALIELSFETEIDAKLKLITIKREWCLDKGNKEKCSIFIDQEYDDSFSKRSHEFIQDLISPELSNLFFFDGEKIESLADPEKSKFIISQGINDLLGVSSIDNIIKSLQVVERRKAAKLAENQEEVSLIEEQQKIELLDKNLKDTNEKIKKLEIEINDKHDEIIDHSKVMSASGAELFKKRDEYKNMLKINLEKADGVNNRIQDYLAGDLPLVLAEDLIRDMRDIQNTSISYTAETASLVKKEIKNFIKSSNIKINDEESNIVKKYFKEIDQNTNKYAFLSNNLHLPDQDFFDDNKLTVQNLLDELERINIEKDNIEKNLSAIPENNQVNELISKEKKLSNELLEIKVKNNLLKNEAIEIQKQLENANKILDQKIQIISEHESVNELDKNIIITSKKSRETLKSYKLRLTEKHIDKINNKVTECFKRIYRKEKDNIKFKINAQDFSISMFIDNKECEISMMSSGERQLLAISILWSLSILANKDMPILIDTPLARLDSKHRKNLLKEYFPKSSHQILIFSTDEEIDARYYPFISSAISHNYLIEHDQVTQTSKLSKGYFEEVASK